MPLARIEIWDFANAVHLADLWTEDSNNDQRSFDKLDSIGSKLNEAGEGRFTVQGDHPERAVLVPGHVARLCAYDPDTDVSTPLFAFTIETVEETTIALSQRDRTIEVAGPGLLARWSTVVVEPWYPGRPVSLDRVWNWASPRGFDDSGWSSTVYVQSRKPEWEPLWPAAFPVGPDDADMVWTLPSSFDQPSNSTLWRRSFTRTRQDDVALFHSADNAADVWCNGVLLNRHSIVYPDRSGWQKTWREVPTLVPGDYVVAYEADNHAPGLGAFLLAYAAPVNTSDELGDPIFATGDGEWKWFDPEGGAKPGFTAPQILEMLLEEAQHRSELVGWSFEFHGDFDEIEEFSCRVGTTYVEVIAQLAVADIDVAADVEGLVLHVWPHGERGDVLDLELGAGSGDNMSIERNADVVNAVQAVWSDGVVNVGAAYHPVVGRRSASLALGSVTDRRAAVRIAQAFLAAHSQPVPSIVGVFEDTEGAVAGVDFSVGDRFPVLGEPVRCVGLTWGVGRDGVLVPVPEFDSLVGQRRRELERTVDRLTAQFDSPASAPILSSKPLLLSGWVPTSEFTFTWGGDIDDLNEDDPDKPSQPLRAERTSRIWKVRIEMEPADLPDAWGVSTVEVLKNGAAVSGAVVSLTTTRAVHEVLVFDALFTPADRISVRAAAQGGHVDGTVTVCYADAV